MSEESQKSAVVTFGYFEVDLRTQELRKRGQRVRLPAQSFQVLCMLLKQPGDLVGRQEMQKALWPNDSFGDFEHGLNAAVNRLREALGDSAERPRFIETLPRRGYRFIFALDSQLISQTSEPAVSRAIEDAIPGSIPANVSLTLYKSRRFGVTVVISIAALGAVLLFLYSMRHTAPTTASSSSDQANVKLVVTPLTALPGLELAPTFSPDASQVAFAWDGGNTASASAFNLYVKVIGSEHLEQITNHPAEWIVPAWSPDGRNIAFARRGEGVSGIFQISARGGPERKLADVSFPYPLTMSLSWSPDGRTLLFASDKDIDVVTLESGEIRALKPSPVCASADAAEEPTYSPNGGWVAFNCYYNGSFSSETFIVPVSGDSARKVLKSNGVPPTLAWSADSQRVLAAVSDGELLEVSRDGSHSQELSFIHDATQPAVSSKGRLAYAQWTRRTNLWRLDLAHPNAGGRMLATPTSREQRAAAISPDGTKIAFESERSGSHEVWVSNLDGNDAQQLSNFHSWSGSPRWSPDGKRIVFDSRESGRGALYLVDPQTAVPKRIPIAGQATVPTWSRDGHWIYYGAGSGAEGGLYKIHPEGGPPLRVSATPGFNIQESTTGGRLYFMTGDTDSPLHVLDVSTAVERPLRGMPDVRTPTEWVVSTTGIYFTDATTQPPTIGFYDFVLTRVTRRIPLPKPPDFWGGLALSPDESWIAYAQVDQNESDLMLVDGFR